MSAFTISTIFSGIDRMSPTITKMMGKMKQLEERGARLNASLGKALGEKAGAAALGAVAVGAAAASVALYDTVQVGMQFEQVMANIKAASGASAIELERISKVAQDVGANVGFSATEIATAMESMSKQGMKTGEIIGAIGGIAAAAKADGADIESTNASLLAAINASGAGKDQIQRFADVFAKAGDSTAASIGSIAESMSKFGGVARQLNIPLESSVAQIAILQDQGIDAASAGTTLAAAYSKLAAPIGATERAIERLGLKVADANGNMKPPDQLMTEILAATDGIEGNVGKMAAFSELVGLESQKALLGIAAAAKSGRLKEITASLGDAAGYAQKIADVKMDTAAGRMAKLKGTVEGLQIELFGILQGPLEGIVSKTGDWLSKNKALVTEKFTQFVDTAVKLGTALGPIVESTAGLAVNIADLAVNSGAVDIIGKAFGLMGWAVGIIKDNIVPIAATAAVLFGPAMVTATGAMAASFATMAASFIAANAPLLVIAATIAGVVKMAERLVALLGGVDATIKTAGKMLNDDDKSIFSPGDWMKASDEVLNEKAKADYDLRMSSPAARAAVDGAIDIKVSAEPGTQATATKAPGSTGTGLQVARSGAI